MSHGGGQLSRRVFLERSAGVALLSGGWGAPAGCAPRDVSPADRMTLSQPGPMLPPVPAVLLSLQGRVGEPDEISVLWSFVVNGDPPQIGVSAGHEHLARELLGLRGEFVLNVPTADMVDAFDAVDMSSGRSADKFRLAGLTRGKATEVRAPTVEEAPIHLECRIFDRVEVPPVRTVYLADVVATTVLPGVCDDAGRLIVPNVRFFGMTAGSGEHYTMGERVGHIGMSVGRNDIRY